MESSVVVDKHYSPGLADAWNLSVDTIRSLFRDEPGVLKMARRVQGMGAVTSLCVFPSKSRSGSIGGCQPRQLFAKLPKADRIRSCVSPVSA
jgi:hypothetical protein